MFIGKYQELCKKHSKVTNDLAKQVIEDRLFDHFSYRVAIGIARGREVKYKFQFKDLPYQKSVLEIAFNQNNELTSCNCLFCQNNDRVCHHVLAGSYFLEQTAERLKIANPQRYQADVESILREFEKAEKEQEERLFKQKRMESLSMFQTVIDQVNASDVLPLIKPVHLEVTLRIQEGDNLDNEVLISVRVGDEKLYVVKNLCSFLVSIKKGEEVTYGKGLSLKHHFDNFDDKAKQLIDLLLISNPTSPSYDRKFINLNSNLVDEVIKIYRGESIFLEYASSEPNIVYTKKYHTVSLEEIPVQLELDQSYQLKLNDPEVDCIFFGAKTTYLAKNKKIYQAIIKEKGMVPLLHFARNNPQFDYHYIKDIFNREIFSRFATEIKVHPSLQNEFVNKDFIISAYFDYDDNQIMVNSKYLLEGQEIKVDKIKEKNYISHQITRYLHFLTSLGFDEKGKITDVSQVINFLKTDLSSLRQLATVYLSDRISKMQIKGYRPVTSRLSYNTGILEVCFENSNYSDEELAKIIKSLRKKVRYVKLNKDTILEIDEQSGEKLLNTIEEFHLNINRLTQKQAIPLYQALKVLEPSQNIIDYRIDDNLKNLLSEIANYKEALFEIPESLKGIMRQYQIEAFKWMKTLIKYHFSGILADDMGLGKTLEIISVLLSDESKEPTLIVCPKSLSYNWKNEFTLWAKELPFTNIIGNANERNSIIESITVNERHIYVTSYDSLRNDLDLYKDKKFRYLILDEAQYIKNHETLKAKSVKQIDSTYRFVLTGTPIENTVLDLWSIFDFLMPNYLSDISEFKSKYEKAIIVENDKEVAERLVKKITPFILRRAKQDVLQDLPEKIEAVQVAIMQDDQRKVYEAELLRTKEILMNPDNKIEIFACMTRLRQICVDPAMYLENYQGSSSKLDLLMEILDEYITSGHRLLIFSQFTSVFDRLQTLLTEKKYKYYILTGKTPSRERVELAQSFNESEEIKVFLVSLKAGGTGLNLVGADVVIHLDPWWNLAAENQATDRAHRIGQKNVVQVIKLVCENSIEQKVLELQMMKKEVVEMIIANGDSNISKLSNDDLKFLFDE